MDKNVLKGFLIFAVITLVFLNLNEAIVNMKTEGLEPNLARLVELLKYLFSNATVAFAVGYLRNLLGYLENWFRARYSQTEISYELERLGETWAKYQAGILAISVWLPTPASAAITFLTDFVTSAIRKLKEKAINVNAVKT